MERHTVRFEAKHLGYIVQALSEIKGDKPILLSYKLGEILRPVKKLQGELQEELKPFLRATGAMRTELTEEENELLLEILNREVMLKEIPVVNLSDLFEANVRMGRDDALPYLIEMGVLGA